MRSRASTMIRRHRRTEFCPSKTREVAGETRSCATAPGMCSMSTTNPCGCCACLSGAGAQVEVENRPGLSALSYRIGSHASFFESMIRRLTIPAVGEVGSYSLHALTTREPDDPAIAFLDAWAIVGDVLTFYEERFANEGFLRTATERRSILELGRLVGY